jgi:Right handed beta helix region
VIHVLLGSTAQAHPAGGSVLVQYFVSPSGSDSLNDGRSQAAPWATIAKVNSSTYQPGDSILFQGGQTFTGGLNLTSSHWNRALAATNPVTIGSYGTGRATISSGTAAGFIATNLGGFHLRDLNFVGAGTTDVDGILVTNLENGTGKIQYVRLTNVNITGYGKSGFMLWGGYGSPVSVANTAGFNDVVLDNVVAIGNAKVHVGNNGTAGIRVQGVYGFTIDPTHPTHTNITVRNCDAHDNLGKAAATSWTGAGIVFGGVQNGLIENCIAYNNGTNSNSESGPVGMMAFDCDTITIQFCEAHHNHTGNLSDGGGFDLDGWVTNSIIQYCYSHDNEGSGFMCYNYSDATATGAWSNNTVRYCISQNDATKNPTGNVEGSISLGSDGGPLLNLKIYNNVAYNNQANGTVLHIGRPNVGTSTGFVANNILYSPANAWVLNAETFAPTITFSGNDYYAAGTFRIKWNNTTYSTLATWKTASSKESGTGLTANPLLVAAGGAGTLGGYVPLSLPHYQLTAGSTMINAGRDIATQFGASIGTRDFYGTSLPVGAGYEVGAYEGTGRTFNEPWTSATNGVPWSSLNWPSTEIIAGGSGTVIDIQSNAGRMNPIGTGAVSGLCRAVALSGTFADTDCSFLITMSNIGEQYHTIVIRGDGLWTGSGGDPLNGYAFVIWKDSAGVGQFSYVPLTAGVRGTGTTIAKNWLTGQWSVRLQAVGTTIRGRAWQGTEPGTWDISVTNSTHAAGKIQISAASTGAAIAKPVLFDNLIVGLPA